MNNQIKILTSNELPVSLSPVDCSRVPTTISTTDNSFSITTPDKLYRTNFHTLNLNDHQLVCYNSYTSPAVLNRTVFSLASLFNSPRQLTEIPEHWHRDYGVEAIKATLTKLVSLSFLIPEDCKTCNLTEKSSILSAWLHVTDRCNLRCTYCYFPHNSVDMSQQTGQSVIDAIFRSALGHEYRHIELKYAGGEAILRFNFINELHRYATGLANLHKLEVNGVILSNGTLLNSKIIREIQTLDLQLTISLDGIEKNHNRQRAYANGNSSFEIVLKNIELLLSCGLTPTISVTVSGCNVEGLPELMAWLLKHDLPFYLNLYRENDYSKSYKNLHLEEEKIIQGMLAAFKVIEANLPRRSLLGSLIDRSDLSTAHLRTCGVSSNYLVFDHLGQVSKCQMEMHSPVTTYKVEDPLALIQADKIGIQNVSVEAKVECSGCEWKYWCTGGCPIMTYKATGRYDVKSPNCRIYKTLYPEAIRLEGLRLIKYAKTDDIFLLDFN
jgi:uncharacterized protein